MVPRSITLDLGDRYDVRELIHPPRLDGNKNGVVTEYKVSISLDGETFSEVATGSVVSYTRRETAIGNGTR